MVECHLAKVDVASSNLVYRSIKNTVIKSHGVFLYFEEAQKMRTWLFDFDGTLVDSMPAFAGVMLRILDENHMTYDRNIVKIITPLGYRDTARYFVEMGLPRTQEELIETMNRYALEEYANRIPAKPHVEEVLRKLKARGDDLNILTASPHMMLDPCLKRLGLYDLFTNVWSCEDFGTNKANPEIYHMAAEKIGRPVEEIWFLDDNLNADRTAKAAGMRVCGVYDESSAEAEDEIRAAADRYIYDFSELL